MKNKELIILLVITLVFSLAFQTCFAAESISAGSATSSEKDSLPNTSYVTVDENGKYIDAKNEDGLKAKMQKEYGVYKLDDGTLLQYTGADNYQRVELVSMSYVDSAAIQDLFTQYTISEEVKNEILRRSTKAIENNNLDASFTLALPYRPLTRGVSTVYYTYNGKPMMDETIFSFGEDTGYEYIKNGTTVKTFASSLYNFALQCAGFASTKISVIAGGLSVFQAWVEYTEEANISGHSDDYLQMCWNYDVSTKYTYCDIGNGWQLGCVTQNVYMNYILTRQYYAAATYNEAVDTENVVNKTTNSPHFNNPAPFAFTNINNPIDESLYTRVGNLTLWY